MQGSKDYLVKNKIASFISFKEKPEHTVKLIGDKEDQIKTKDGMVTGMKYMVEENGEPKSFFTQSVGLIQKLAQYNEGDEVTIKMVSKKIDGTFKSSFVVTKVGETSTEEEESEAEIVDATIEKPSF